MKTEIELKKELEVLKQTHGIIREMVVFLDTDDESKQATIFLKKPDKTTRSVVGKLITQEKFDRAIESCLKSLYIGGDSLDLILNNDDAIESAGMGIVELLKVQQATLKKN